MNDEVYAIKLMCFKHYILIFLQTSQHLSLSIIFSNLEVKKKKIISSNLPSSFNGTYFLCLLHFNK